MMTKLLVHIPANVEVQEVQIFNFYTNKLENSPNLVGNYTCLFMTFKAVPGIETGLGISGPHIPGYRRTEYSVPRVWRDLVYVIVQPV